jgi:hypothetical protein
LGVTLARHGLFSKGRTPAGFELRVRLGANVTASDLERL